MEILKKKTEELFSFFNSFAPTCGKCGEKYSCVAVRYCDLVIGIYSCDCEGKAKNLRVYRGVSPETWKKAEEILGEEDLLQLRTQERAAVGAKIICPHCQKPMKYIESAILPDGSVQHRFDCRNANCPEFEKTIWTKLSESNCKRIFAQLEKEAECRICKEIKGSKIHCLKHGGFVCEKHCGDCEHGDFSTSKFICRFKK